MQIFLLILGILMFIGLVVVHEFGHFIAARNNGVEAEEFGIGFPPRAWSRKIKSKKGDYIFSINWLPIGGFVKLKGESDTDTEKGTFGAANTWVKTKIMAAGVLMNFLTAIVLFTLVALIGMPQVIDNQFTVASDTKVTKIPKNEGVVKLGRVVPGSPAAKAGLKVGMRIESIAGVTVNSPDKLTKNTRSHAGQTVSIVFSQDGKASQTKQVHLNSGSSGNLGVAPYSLQNEYRTQRSTWSAPVVAVGLTKQFTILTFKGLGTAVKGVGSIIAGFFSGNTEARRTGQSDAGSQVSGPLGIFVVLKNGAAQGIGFIIFIVAIISLSLAIMNILPIPALDGGKLAATYVSRLFGKQVSKTFEAYAYGTSMLLLLGLMIIITFVDAKHFL